jgi:hypothetical protein
LAEKLIDAGYDPDNIKILRAGWFRWLELGYPTETGG